MKRSVGLSVKPAITSAAVMISTVLSLSVASTLFAGDRDNHETFIERNARQVNETTRQMELDDQRKELRRQREEMQELRDQAKRQQNDYQRQDRDNWRNDVSR